MSLRDYCRRFFYLLAILKFARHHSAIAIGINTIPAKYIFFKNR